MEESVTYQAIIREGEALGAIWVLERMLLRQGEIRFRRAPSKKVRSRLLSLKDVAVLEVLAERILTATSWEDLLGLPEPRR